MVLWQVLQLNTAPGPALRAVGSGELEEAMCPSIFTDIPIRCLILFHRRLRHLQSQFQHVQRFLIKTALIDLLDHGGNILLPQRIDLNPAFFQPALQL